MSPDLREATGELRDPAIAGGYVEPPERVGFFTDTSVCIGCKACEVACKEWNAIPEDGLSFTGMSYDNTGQLDANSWRHVAFVEQPRRLGRQEAQLAPAEVPAALRRAAGGRTAVSLGMPGSAPPDGHVDAVPGMDFRWLMSSDVCKHCTHAACLDVCPTGSLFRTEFGTVVVQQDICNGCGYCVPACPFGVLDVREDDGRVWKCTLCYDRLSVGQEPACAKSCPTDSIQFGELSELRARAAARVSDLHDAGVDSARLYGADPYDGVGGAGAFFLLLDEPEVYGLPPDPVVTTRDLPAMWRRTALVAAGLLAALIAVSLPGARR
ncbi:4Fe-4S dicluster domain-containing protein [Plantactinospora veratri]|uniref:4Fe-4S dicluster domain-containing protein n=1 Tax=Plantactinospora veratri TaxID=1436122 RepID=A0ABU7S969_9ACTN